MSSTKADELPASAVRQAESLVDILASIRIELTAGHSYGPFAVADRDRVQRSLAQVEMALSMAKDLASWLRLQDDG
jgi:hypothetical protein